MNWITVAADKRSRHGDRMLSSRALKERLLRCVSILLATALVFAIQSPAGAEELSYLGAWKFVSVVPAPWAPSPQKADIAGMKQLTGKTVNLGLKAITGPKVLACKGPHYKVSDFSADMLFQGQFGEMHAPDHGKDPLQLAHALGFTGTTFKTLETGCEIDWHFVDPRTAEIGLNNFVYTLKKQ
jgi:hypothetical protein